jgi:RNA polymerase sigma-70 factor (ECF subfamily)
MPNIEEILAKYERLIYHICYRYFGNAEDARDAAQDTAVKIWRALPTVKVPEDGSLKAWVATIAARVCLDGLRKKRVIFEEMPDDIPASQESAEDEAMAREHTREILAAIQKLPEDQRMVLILREMNGLSYDEIATALQQPTGTVKSRLNRARTALAGHFANGG